MDMLTDCRRPAVAFTMVPNSLISDPTLSPVAKAALIYMASHRPGFIVRRGAIMAAIGISIRTWNRAARELRTRGALKTVPAGKGGYAGIRGQYLLADWSEWFDNPTDPAATNGERITPRESKVTKYDDRERDPDSDPKGIPTRIPLGSTNKRERKKEARTRVRAKPNPGAAEGRAERDPRFPPPTPDDDEDEPRELPSIERRRQLMRELGVWPSTLSAQDDPPPGRAGSAESESEP